MYFDPAGAHRKLERIINDPSFAPVWKSLRTFVTGPNCRLIITLGNHDIELALPWVREHLLQELAGSNSAARGRITLAFEGFGWRCAVGRATVLCVHGNEVDSWNVTDYEALRRAGRDLSWRRERVQWRPNAGTRLVVDVMNDIKKEYPFVDLLKPEAEAVLPTLLALDPRVAAKVGDLLPSAFRRGWDSLRIRHGFLMADGETHSDVKPTNKMQVDFLSGLVGDAFGQAGASTSVEDVEYLLEETEKRFNEDVSPADLLRDFDGAEFLGITAAIRNVIRRRGRSEVLSLREALERLKQDRSFDFMYADETYRSLGDRIGACVDFVIAGHTHLERALPLGEFGRYFNSGTWARLMKFTDKALSDERMFESIFAALQGPNGISVLESLGVIVRRPTVVAIYTNGAATRAELRHVTASGPNVFEVAERSQFVRT
jgi:hypothetical protein